MQVARVLLLRSVNLIAGVVGVFLAIRIVLKVFGAGVGAPIVSWIYSISDTLVAPFRGIFQDILLGGSSFLDLSAIIALIVYMIIFSIITALINSFTHPISIDEHNAAHV